MTKIRFVLAISVLFLLIAACSSFQSSDSVDELPQNAPPADFILPLTEAEVPRVTVEEAKAALDNGTAIIVDVRSGQAYDAEPYPRRAYHPTGRVRDQPSKISLPKDGWIITYCT
ncbi:MAG: hypothetical protein MZV64_58920 [Ignavibacteriales bacterium]|nr:hypothetical protein [Ignavibacteriales bacterium]